MHSTQQENWTKTNLDATATYQWKQSATGMHSGSKCAVVKWDGSAGLPQQDEWLISPSLNLTTLSTPILSFWWSMSYGYSVSPYNNYDCRVKVSTNGGTTWTVIWTEDSAGVFTDFVYQKKTIDLTPYATSTNFKIAFQYYGKDGWDLFIDDVYVGDLPNNLIEFTSITDPGMVGVNPPIWSGYTQVPSGQNLPVLFTVKVPGELILSPCCIVSPAELETITFPESVAV